MSNVQAAVTASSVEAVAAGEYVLRAGGNAVDAAVAAALASCVSDPCNTGIGGHGGHMIVAPANETPACIDFNLWAPTATMETYRRDLPLGPGASVIPNVVAGLSAALRTFGSKMWSEIVWPAVALAENGFTAGATLRRALQEVRGADFLDDCFTIERGETGSLHVCQPSLARTLRQLAAQGPRWFYEGPIAEIGSRCLQHSGHRITPEHWNEALDAVTIAPAAGLRLADIELFSAPLGTSGSICMFATVVAGETLGHDLESPANICRWAEQMAAAWSYRFGAPNGNSVPGDGIAEWIGRATAFKAQAAVTTSTGHTCHLNTADKNGMLVAATITHGKLWFGARWALPGTGVIMNYGGPMICTPEPRLVGQRAYGVTNMSPTIVRLEDGATLAIGSPGARRIASIVGTVISRHVFHRVALQQAITRGRFHAESRQRATLELDRLSHPVKAALQAAFEMVEAEGPMDYYGPCTAIRRDADGGVTLGIDDRWPGFGVIIS